MAESLAAYTIHRAGTPIVIDGRLDEPAWVGAPDVGAFVFPWYESGKKEQTVAKLLWDDENLYAAFICDVVDEHIQLPILANDTCTNVTDCPPTI